ncbi:hypothetical protein VOM14_18665 [Paraburkholderia sp. MPAMCS5]|uniref:hypothetical protein n=1 Tax=Paraburkholderia sp. MPAMCS5 TaxID=3112563 RepID=UPI002E1A00C0|nr:hypothetical protein [Paraburkholderia sp. MPAMCS5]
MSVIEGFERKALFNITRAVALVCVSVFLLAIIGIAIYGASVWNDEVQTKVTPSEIINQIKPPEPVVDAPRLPQGAQPPANQEPQDSPLYGYRIPFSLQKYVSGSNAQVIRNHLDKVPRDERQAYIDELGTVVSAAESNKLDPVDAINAYMKLKAERYDEATVARMRKWETLKFAAAGFGAGLLLIALFSLVLVLLAIERNTRNSIRVSASARTEEESHLEPV